MQQQVQGGREAMAKDMRTWIRIIPGKGSYGAAIGYLFRGARVMNLLKGRQDWRPKGFLKPLVVSPEVPPASTISSQSSLAALQSPAVLQPQHVIPFDR